MDNSEEVDLFSLLMEGGLQDDVRETIIKPPFAWAGSKARSIEHILKHLPYRDIFVDVFGGSACVTLARRPSKLDVYNDSYSGLVDFYKCIKDEKLLKQLLEWLELTCYSRELFSICKSEWKNTIDPAERAAKWYYMLSCSFGTLGRNFGRATSASVNLAQKFQNKFELFWPVHQRFKTVQIENQDYSPLLKDYDGPNTVFYMDPPYWYADPGLYEESWPLDKHKKMLRQIFELHGFVALSGYDNALYNSLPWDHKFEWDVRTTIQAKNCVETNGLKERDATMSKTSTECLWIKEAT